jgi:hypothetical protein
MIIEGNLEFDKGRWVLNDHMNGVRHAIEPDSPAFEVLTSGERWVQAEVEFLNEGRTCNIKVRNIQLSSDVEQPYTARMLLEE